MSCSKVFSTVIAAAAVLCNAPPTSAGFGDTDQDRVTRWNELKKQIFGDKKAATDDKVVQLDAPGRAEDAALVPITIKLAKPEDVKALYLIIDENPSPVAAHFTFGSAMDASSIKMRVRVNAYTTVHAVAETKDGRLAETAKYVKASGGCSAPMGMSDDEAMKGMGEMKFKVASEIAAGKPAEATLMVRHPNFNGMQINQTTRDFTPARYIQTIAVKFNDTKVFDLDTDISLATNPVISFALLPDASRGAVKIEVKDSQHGAWSKLFNLPTVSN